jgi:putative multiple sugar transport system substrate-binding protein
MEQLLTDYFLPSLDAVLAPNDTIARGIIAVLKANSAYWGGSTWIPSIPVITGQDAEWDSYQSILADEQYMTVYKNTWKMAEAAVILADQILDGSPINIPGAPLATGSLADLGNTGGPAGYVDTYLLEPVLITKANTQLLWDEGWFD